MPLLEMEYALKEIPLKCRQTGCTSKQAAAKQGPIVASCPNLEDMAVYVRQRSDEITDSSRVAEDVEHGHKP